MSTDRDTRPGPAVEPRTRLAAAAAAIASGAAVLLDTPVDIAGSKNAVLNTAGVAAPVLAVLAVAGITACLRRPGPLAGPGNRLLDLGAVANIVGLALLTGIEFSRVYVLFALDEPVRDALTDSAPTMPAVYTAGVLYVAGGMLFAAALVRERFVPVAAWLLLLTALPGTLVDVLPLALVAVFQAVTGAAFVLIGVRLLPAGRSRAAVPVLTASAS
ncbi:hypothetical protein [Parafrankia discariae]|uniref:hypothetical protein n=1 Tax=Parafrankia discariae TaxID=365528 RepID=UPI00039B7F06|nr:hypothetical protein [Parafrankia discariae]